MADDEGSILRSVQFDELVDQGLTLYEHGLRNLIEQVHMAQGDPTGLGRECLDLLEKLGNERIFRAQNGGRQP